MKKSKHLFRNHENLCEINEFDANRKKTKKFQDDFSKDVLQCERK